MKLGFVPEGAEQVVLDNGVVDFLTYTYSTWTSGGGAAKLDVPKLFDRVRELAADTDDGLFQVSFSHQIALSYATGSGGGYMASYGRRGSEDTGSGGAESCS